MGSEEASLEYILVSVGLWPNFFELIYFTNHLHPKKIMNTYAEMMAQIEELQKQAEKIRKEEFASVVKAIKTQIRDYGITAQDLGLGLGSAGEVGKNAKRPGGKSARKVSVKRLRARVKVAPKYRDHEGNTWTGRGKQPKWIVAALSSGRTLDSFLIS